MAFSIKETNEMRGENSQLLRGSVISSVTSRLVRFDVSQLNA